MFQLRLFKSPALLGFLAFTLLSLSACDRNRQYVLKRLPAGDNRWITISADETGEISRSIYYQVKIGEETVVPTGRMCNAANDPDSMSFKIVSASDGNLVGLYEETNPERVLALHDFAQGRSWPQGAPNEWTDDINNRGEELLKQLQHEYPNSNFRLNYWAACGIRIPDKHNH